MKEDPYRSGDAHPEWRQPAPAETDEQPVAPYHARLPLIATFGLAYPLIQVEVWRVDGDGVPVLVYLYLDDPGRGLCLRCVGVVTCRHMAAAWAAREGQGAE